MNEGFINYARDSIVSDERFFTQAYRFYRELRTRDASRRSRTYIRSPIQEVAEFDVYQLALQIAGGNPYSALRLMAVYGHDNINNELNVVEPMEDAIYNSLGN